MEKTFGGKVARLIEQEDWKLNLPKPEKDIELWKPAPKPTIETDPLLMSCVCVCVVSEKTWTGLAVKDFGPEGGLGERTFHLTCKQFSSH